MCCAFAMCKTRCEEVCCIAFQQSNALFRVSCLDLRIAYTFSHFQVISPRGWIAVVACAGWDQCVVAGIIGVVVAGRVGGITLAITTIRDRDSRRNTMAMIDMHIVDLDRDRECSPFPRGFRRVAGRRVDRRARDVVAVSIVARRRIRRSRNDPPIPGLPLQRRDPSPPTT